MFNENDYCKLLDCMFRVATAVHNKFRFSADEKVVDAEGLLRKNYFFAASALHLQQGTKINTERSNNYSFIDYGTINAICRNVLECVSTFYYVFLPDVSVEEKEFRYKMWVAEGYISRQKYQPRSNYGKEKLALEKTNLEQLKDEIRSNSVFKTLKEKTREKHLAKGDWRLGRGWKYICKNSGLDDFYVDAIYNYTSAYIHPISYSVTQQHDANESSIQKELTRLPMGCILILMAKHVVGYLQFFPQCANCFYQEPDLQQLIRLYDEVGREDFEALEINDEDVK